MFAKRDTPSPSNTASNSLGREQILADVSEETPATFE